MDWVGLELTPTNRMSNKSLRNIVKNSSGQDVYRCRECLLCNIEQQDDMDVPLQTIIKMTMFDDEEVLTCRTIWSDRVLLAAIHSCKRGLNMQAIMLALRDEARLRGYEHEG